MARERQEDLHASERAQEGHKPTKAYQDAADAARDRGFIARIFYGRGTAVAAGAACEAYHRYQSRNFVTILEELLATAKTLEKTKEPPSMDTVKASGLAVEVAQVLNNLGRINAQQAAHVGLDGQGEHIELEPRV